MKKGDLIGLLSPASPPLPAEKIERSVRYFESRGYQVEVGPHASAVHGYLAGSDQQRLDDLNHMIRNPHVKAIFAIRGGYGTPRLLDRIDYRALRRSPKILVGYSDITALQLAVYRRTRLVTFSGPMPGVEFWKRPDPYTEAHFWKLITSPRAAGRLPPPDHLPIRPLRTGRSSGILIPANLALLTSLMGTPYLPSLAGCILALEDVDEPPYRIDRMFTQLRLAGILKQLAGLALGHFTHCEPRDQSKPDRSSREVLNETTTWCTCPAIGSLPYGHIPRKLTLPLGVVARLDGKQGSLSLTEPAVQ